MSPILWLIIIVAVLIAVVALFALMRIRQRSGDVLASQPATRNGGGQ